MRRAAACGLTILALGVPVVAQAQGAAPEPAGAKVLRRRIRAADGAALAMFRYVPAGGGRTKAPVLLIPDVGLGRLAFDLGGSGLAPWLQARGYEVFVLEPRGSGSSEDAPDAPLAILAVEDVAAAIAVIRAERTEPLSLVVHGYLGALVMGATVKELREGGIGRVVAMSTPAMAEVPNRYVEALLERGGPLSSLAMDPAGAAIFELLFTRHSVMARPKLAVLRSRAFSDLGPVRSAALLAWMREGDVAYPDGSTLLERWRAYDRPTLQLIALRDNWVHPEHASPLRELAPSAPIEVRLLSLMEYLEEDYTHLSMLHGDGAAADVFPLVDRFLSAPGDAQRGIVAGEGAP